MTRRLLFVAFATTEGDDRQIFRVEQLNESPDTKYELIEVEEPDFREGFYTSLKWDNKAKKFVYEEIEIPKSREQLIEEELNALKEKNAELETAKSKLVEQNATLVQTTKEAIAKTEALEGTVLELMSSMVPILPEEVPEETVPEGDVKEITTPDMPVPPIGDVPKDGEKGNTQEPEPEIKKEPNLTPDEKKEIKGDKNITNEEFLEMVEKNKEQSNEASGIETESKEGEKAAREETSPGGAGPKLEEM